MTTLSQDTYATFGVPLTGLGGGGGSAVSTFDNLFITSTLTTLDLVAFNISTSFIEADDAIISSISTLGIYLDGVLLTAAPAGGGSELLLNGIPIATTSNISSLADWSLDPAISTLNMNGNPILNATNVSSLDVYASTIYADKSFALDAFASTLTVTDFTSENAVLADSISSLSGAFSSLAAGKIGYVLEINGDSVLEGGGNLGIFGLSTVNGEPFVNGNTVITSTINTSSIAVSSITSLGGATDDLTLSGTSRYLNMYSQGMSNVIDRGADIGGNAFYRLTAQNGNAGEISLVSEPGFLGNYGRISLTANGGTLAGVGLGGLVEINANTPAGSLCNASSAIKLNAAGINSYAGAVPSVGSLAGYNFVYGTLGVNLTAGLPPGTLPNTPGTVYLYGTTGVVSGSPVYAYELLGYWNGVASPSNLRITGRQTLAGNSQVVVSNVDSIFFDTGYGALSGVSSINNQPYPPTGPSGGVQSSIQGATDSFVFCGPAAGGTDGNISISTSKDVGREQSIKMNADTDVQIVARNLVSISSTSLALGQTGQISIDINANTIVSNRDYTAFVSLGGTDGTGYGSAAEVNIFTAPTNNIEPPTFPDVGIMTILSSGVISITSAPGGNLSSFANIAGVSSIAGFPDLDIRANGVKITGVNASLLDPGGAGFQVLGGLCKIGGAAGTEVQGNISVSTLTDVSSINGISFPPTYTPPEELVVSSLTSATFVSTPEITVSSINGVEFPQLPYELPADITVSTLTAASFVSTPELYISSINGQEYLPGAVPANLELSTLTVASYVSAPQITVSTLDAGLISTAQITASSINGQAFSNNLTLSTLTVAGTAVMSTLQINTISTVNMIDFGGFARLGANSGSLYIQNCTTIDPPPNTDMIINSEAPGVLFLGGRNGEVALNVGINISTTGNRMTFQQASGQNIGALAGISSINDIPVASFVANNPSITTSTLTAATYVSTPSLLGVSSINSLPVSYYNSGAAFNLAGTTLAASISTFATGSGNPLTQNVFTNVSRIRFNIPPNWIAGTSVYYDGLLFYDFDANVNTYWGVNYFTNTNPTPVDLIGSTTSTINAITESNVAQFYFPLNVIIPPTSLTAGGTITLTVYCNPTSANHYLTLTPVINARVGIVLN